VVLAVRREVRGPIASRKGLTIPDRDSDLQAIATTRRAIFYLVQEDNPLVILDSIEVNIPAGVDNSSRLRVQNQGELGVDCGGLCEKACPSCYNEVQDEGESGIDCGGPCTSCREQYQVTEISGWVVTIGSAGLLVVLLLLARTFYFVIKKYALVYFRV